MWSEAMLERMTVKAWGDAERALGTVLCTNQFELGSVLNLGVVIEL